MKIKLPEGLKNFDMAVAVLRRLPKHLNWFHGKRIRELPEDQLRQGSRYLRPFTTLEIWLASKGVFVVRTHRAYFLRDNAVHELGVAREEWGSIAKHYPLLTTAAVPKLLTTPALLSRFLKERGLKPPRHIFSDSASFVAEELPAMSSTYINSPTHHAC